MILPSTNQPSRNRQTASKAKRPVERRRRGAFRGVCVCVCVSMYVYICVRGCARVSRELLSSTRCGWRPRTHWLLRRLSLPPRERTHPTVPRYWLAAVACHVTFTWATAPRRPRRMYARMCAFLCLTFAVYMWIGGCEREMVSRVTASAPSPSQALNLRPWLFVSRPRYRSALARYASPSATTPPCRQTSSRLRTTWHYLSDAASVR